MRSFLLIFLLLLVGAVGILITGSIIKVISEEQDIAKIDYPSDENSKKAEFIEAVVESQPDSVIEITVSKAKDLELNYEYDNSAGFHRRRVFSGRRINIIITGVDSRLGSRFKHADANHILSILPDKGKIEIISIPRDTPADAGLDDTTGQNKLTVVRGVKGRKAYLEEAARIAGLDRIHYYVEFGFSQAMGILELIGYKKSVKTLKMLRSRSALGGDDYQRTYNQARFIKQMILKNFGRLSGTLGQVFVRGGVTLVETNLKASKIIQISEQLKSAGFPESADDIRLMIRPAINIRFKQYDFTDKNVLSAIYKKIDEYSAGIDSSNSDPSDYVAKKLGSAIERSYLDTAKRPSQVIGRLKVYFDQRAWFQIRDRNLRDSIRDKIAYLLIDAYEKKKWNNSAQKVKDILLNQKKLFSDSGVNIENKNTVSNQNSSTFQK